MVPLNQREEAQDFLAASPRLCALREHALAAYALREGLLRQVLCLRLLALSCWIEKHLTLRP